MTRRSVSGSPRHELSAYALSEPENSNSVSSSSLVVVAWDRTGNGCPSGRHQACGRRDRREPAVRQDRHPWGRRGPVRPELSPRCRARPEPGDAEVLHYESSASGTRVRSNHVPRGRHAVPGVDRGRPRVVVHRRGCADVHRGAGARPCSGRYRSQDSPRRHPQDGQGDVARTSLSMVPSSLHPLHPRSSIPAHADPPTHRRQYSQAGPFFESEHASFFNLELHDTNVVDHNTHDYGTEGVRCVIQDLVKTS